MKILVNIVIFICASISTEAQINIVRNGSFEQHWRCPTGVDQIRFSNYWSPIDTDNTYPELADTFGCLNCTPEYINVCGLGDASAPFNGRFFQYPRTGDAMAQVQMFFDETYSALNKRDYLQGRLYKNLISGKTYCITFYVNFEGSATSIPCQYAVDHIGAYLDNGSICQDTGLINCGRPKPSIIPQLYTTTIITDTVKWTKVQGSFVANGNEKFITIGNFFDKASTNYIAYPNTTAFSWYLVDDVSVIESTEVAHAGIDKGVAYGDSVWIGTNEEGMPCTWYMAGDTTPVGYSGGIWVKPTVTTTYVVEMDLCGNVTRDTVQVTVWPVGVPFGKHTMTERDVLLYPNPAGDEVTVGGASSGVLTMTDAVGRVVVSATMSSNKEVVNISHLPKGIYIVQIADPVTGAKVVKRVVKE